MVCRCNSGKELKESPPGDHSSRPNRKDAYA